MKIDGTSSPDAQPLVLTTTTIRKRGSSSKCAVRTSQKA